MINFNTKEILKIIPIEPSLRDKILNEYDGYPEAQKYEISSYCLDIFSEYTDKLAQIKYDGFMAEAEEGKRSLSPTMMQEAYQAVHKDYDDIITGKIKETQQIDEIRNKIQNFLQSQK